MVTRLAPVRVSEGSRTRDPNRTQIYLRERIRGLEAQREDIVRRRNIATELKQRGTRRSLGADLARTTGELQEAKSLLKLSETVSFTERQAIKRIRIVGEARERRQRVGAFITRQRKALREGRFEKLTPTIRRKLGIKLEEPKQENIIRQDDGTTIKSVKTKPQLIPGVTSTTVVDPTPTPPPQRTGIIESIRTRFFSGSGTVTKSGPQFLDPVRIVDVRGPTRVTRKQTPEGEQITTTVTGGGIRVEGPEAFKIPSQKILESATKGGEIIETPKGIVEQSKVETDSFSKSLKDYAGALGFRSYGILGPLLATREQKEAAARTETRRIASIGKFAVGTGEFVSGVFKTGFSNQLRQEDLDRFQTAGVKDVIGFKSVDFGKRSQTIKKLKERPFSVTDIEVGGIALGASLSVGVPSFVRTAKQIGIGPAIGQTTQTLFTPFGPTPGTYVFTPKTPSTVVATRGNEFVRVGKGTERAFTGLDDPGRIVKTSIFQRGIIGPRGTATSVRTEVIKGAPFFDVRGGFVTKGVANVVRVQRANLFGTGTVFQGVVGQGLKNPLAVATGKQPAQVGVSGIRQDQTLFLQSSRGLTILRSSSQFQSGTVADRLFNNPSNFFTGDFKKGTLNIGREGGREFRIGEPFKVTDTVRFVPDKNPLQFGGRLGVGIGGGGRVADSSLIQQPQITTKGTVAQTLVGTSQITAPSTGLILPPPTITSFGTPTATTTGVSQTSIGKIGLGTISTTTTIPTTITPSIPTSGTISTQITPIAPFQIQSQVTKTGTTTTGTTSIFVPRRTSGYRTFLSIPTPSLGFTQPRRRKRRARRSFIRAPSFAAFQLGISAPKVRKREAFGLVERPLLKKKKKRKRRSK